MLRLTHSLEVGLAVASVAMFVASVVAIPIFLVRVPADYFTRPRDARGLTVRVLRAVLGVTLIGLGIVMLVLPGQGVLTILVGLSVLDVPLRDRIVVRILRNPKVHQAIDELRRKHGRDSLHLPSLPRTA